MAMKRVLTGIQPTGVPHLGNILGAIIPAIQMSKDASAQTIAFIANLHSLTTIKKIDLRRNYSNAVAACWLAFGFDVDKNILFRQSDVTEVCELTWFLSCFTPFPMLANAHSFKDKSSRLSDVNAGLFTYPVLMAADILLYDTDVVPVGKDQLQHMEIARDLARSVNHMYGEVFVLPEARTDERVMIVPGTDGKKMSKSSNNFINIFLPEKELRKIVMSVVTDSKSVEEPKDPHTCNVFKLYELIASIAQVEEMRKNYVGGNFGYGSAKQALFELIIDKFKNERKSYNYYMENNNNLEIKLKMGANKAKLIAQGVLERVRTKLGYN